MRFVQRCNHLNWILDNNPFFKVWKEDIITGGPNPENNVHVEAFWNVSQRILQEHSETCVQAHYCHKRAFILPNVCVYPKYGQLGYFLVMVLLFSRWSTSIKPAKYQKNQTFTLFKSQIRIPPWISFFFGSWFSSFLDDSTIKCLKLF